MSEFIGISSKDDFVKEIATRRDYNQSDCKKVVDTIIEILHDCITEKQEFNVRGFGQLRYVVTKEHEGSKPTPGVKGKSEKIWIPEKESVRFHLSKDLRNHMKEDVEDEESS